MPELSALSVSILMALSFSSSAPPSVIALKQSGEPPAQQIQYGPEQVQQKSDLLLLAARLGRASGDAEFCEYDPRVVEDFIINAQARLARETSDNLRMAGARLEFNAFAAYGRSRGPETGCEDFEAEFADLRRFVQR